ncbi:MAG: PTS system mannose/fructose/sorbose family transporter subunit IID [Elusimicrobiota bacterium]|jgi:PTS system mannose-specific IID component|nr:PTS system mannose/fructose/sorbose family transporter subunit IID [Elusimicrobiota bacterium]
MKILLSVFLRSYLLQGFWNYAQMQNIGALFALTPALKYIYKKDAEGLRHAVARNVEAFNTNPVLSTYSLGALIGQERKISATPIVSAPSLSAAPSRQDEEREYRIIRAGTANTAASLGDRLFWATLKPLSLVLCLTILFGAQVQILHEDMPSGGAVFEAALAVIASLLLYNVPATAARIKGLADSFRGTEDDFYGLIKINWNKIIYFLKTLGQVFTVFVIFCGLYLRFSGESVNVDLAARFALCAAFVVLSVFMKKLNIPNMFLYLGATAFFTAASLLA